MVSKLEWNVNISRTIKTLNNLLGMPGEVWKRFPLAKTGIYVVPTIFHVLGMGS